MFKKFRLPLISATSISALTLIAVVASPASATPSPGSATSSSPASATVPHSVPTPVAESMSQDEAMNAILRTNPNARRVGPNAVNVAPGLDIIYGPVDKTTAAGSATVASTPYYKYCYPYYLCAWQHTIGDGFGYGLAFSYCAGIYNLNNYRFPDGAYVGPGPTSQRWNDKISSYENSQSTGTVSHFYNWIGYWSLIWNSTAFDAHYNLTQLGINDIIDGIFVC